MNIRAAGLCLLAVLLPSAQGQEIWREVTENGDVRYADRPFAGAVAVALPGSSRWTGGTMPAREEDDRDTPKPPDAPGGNGQELLLLRPAAEETVWGAGGELEVTLAGDFELQTGSRLLLDLDGVEAEWRGKPPQVRLNAVWRGEHRLRARVLDAEGRELASSREVRFYKREPSVTKPNAP